MPCREAKSLGPHLSQGKDQPVLHTLQTVVSPGLCTLTITLTKPYCGESHYSQNSLAF